MKWTIAVIGVFAAFVVLGIVVVAWGIGTRNTAQALKIQYEAKVSANKGELDNLKKKLADYRGITDLQIESLTKIFVDYAQARSTNSDKLLVNWVKEAVPNVDQSTFKQF